MMLLIEDLPVANGRIAQGRLLNCLQPLVKSVQIPTVILITDYSAADSADSGMRYWEELSSSLESAGACKVAVPQLYFCFLGEEGYGLGRLFSVQIINSLHYFC